MSDPEDPGGVGDRRYRVEIADEQDVAVDVHRLERLAVLALASLGVAGGAELSIVLTDPETMRRLKGEYLGEDAATDVLAFPMDAEPPGGGTPHLIGDVVLCPDVAGAQAKGLGRTFEEEMALLLVHGILHLLGHDHAEPEEQALMQAEERRILGSFAAAPA